MPAASPGMIVSKVALTRLAFSPMTAPSAFTRSASMPMTVWPSGAMNSFGAYCASVATFNVPLAFIAAGTCEETVGLALLVVVFTTVIAVELVLLLLLPQPASTRTVSAGIPIRATSLLIASSSIELTCDPHGPGGEV